MDTAQQILFGESGFPRTVAHASNGKLLQHFIHSADAFDMFFKHNRPDHNLYSSICRFRSDMRPVNCTVPFDFDSPMKDSVFDNETDREKVELMREDKELAEEVLGEVWEDTQALIKQCKRDNIPVLTVFSGLGVHAHMLYKDRVNPVKEKVSTSNYYIDECDLTTYDRQIVTDTRRILRIPNSQRVDDGVSAGVWCIPITENEVLNNTIHDLLERCASPKDIPFHDRYKKENRPDMDVKEGYEEVDIDTAGTVELHKRDIAEEVPEMTEWIIRESIPLPCVKERFLCSNPNHQIRFAGVVHLFQAGFTPAEVVEIIERIGWVDFDRSITESMVKNIYKNKYSELSCSKLMSLGLCVHGIEEEGYSDEPSDCETYKYTSGEALYPYQDQ